MKTIVSVNQKGGVGKTTSAVNVAAGLAQAGKRVLLVDLDPQAQAGTALGMKPEMAAYFLLTMPPCKETAAFLVQYVRETGRDNLALLPGSQETMTAQTVINASNKPLSHIKDALHLFRADYDYLVIDTAPSVGGIQERAIWAADLVIIPTATEYLSVDGVRKVAEMLAQLKAKGWKGGLLGVLPTFFDEQTRESAASYDDLKQGFREFVLPVIHRATVLRECAAEAKTIFEKDPKSRSADEYKRLVKLVLKY